ncbi:MAG: acyl--CoA ligase [Bacteroidales bacterium]|nr:acyl--CoA ligase [Bacteroidales bacterium]
MGEEKKLTGYPSIDKPWLKYYSKEAINASLPEDTIFTHIKKCSENRLLGTAINYYGKNISYRVLIEKIELIASALEGMGVREGSIVSVCMLNSPETIYLILALNKIGATANMLCGMDSSSEIKRHLLDTESKYVFTLDIFQEKIQALISDTCIEKVVVSTLTQEMSFFSKVGARLLKKAPVLPIVNDHRFISWNQFVKYNTGESSTANDPTAPAFITYTGGTTGGSKGVLLSSAAVLAVSEQYIIGEAKIRPDSKWMLVLPLFIAFGLICVSIPLMTGMTIIVRLPMGETIGDVCKRFKPNYYVFSPAFWEDFADKNEKLDLSSLVSPISGGDVLTEKAERKIDEYLQRCGCKTRLMNGYGMSEVCAAVSVNFDRIYEFGSVGTPFVKNIISAFDVDSGEELQYGQEGEICIHTPSMMIGYLKNEEETSNIIRMHEDGLLWIHSGDLGYISENGFIHISGRLKRYILTFYNGVAKKVFCLDIEKRLIENPIVEKCVTVPYDSEEFNQVPVTFVILSKGVVADKEAEKALRKYADENLEDIYRPVRYFFVDSFPHTKVGKIDYRSLETKAKEL